MMRYDLTEDGYLRKFRTSKPETDETSDQFIVRISTYFMRWVELSETEQSFRPFKGVKGLYSREWKVFIVKEQFINSCPKELAVYLRERAPETLDKMADCWPVVGSPWLILVWAKSQSLRQVWQEQEVLYRRSDANTVQSVWVFEDTRLWTVQLRRRSVVIAVESKATKHGTVDLTIQSQLRRVMQVGLDLKDS